MLALLLAALLVAGSPAAATARPLKMIWGPNTLPNGRSAFPTYHRLGVNVLQIQLSWANTATRRPGRPANPRDPAYHWPATLDTAVRQARRWHIAVAVMVKATPAWANGGRSIAWAPNDPRDYARFMQAAVRRYPYVHYWMIWGEPTRPGNFLPMSPNNRTGPRRYARLLDTAYGAIKAVNRRDVVIGGMTWTFGTIPPAQFVKWMRLPNGKPPRLDMYGHNPFSRRFPRLADTPYYPGLRDLNEVDTLSAEVDRAYRPLHRRPKLWLSEWTISSDRTNRGYDFFVSRKQQARWISAAYGMLRRARYVEGLGWYSLYDDPPSVRNGLTTGLLTYSGARKPAFYAYANAP